MGAVSSCGNNIVKHRDAPAHSKFGRCKKTGRRKRILWETRLNNVCDYQVLRFFYADVTKPRVASESSTTWPCSTGAPGLENRRRTSIKYRLIFRLVVRRYDDGSKLKHWYFFSFLNAIARNAIEALKKKKFSWKYFCVGDPSMCFPRTLCWTTNWTLSTLKKYLVYLFFLKFLCKYSVK